MRVNSTGERKKKKKEREREKREIIKSNGARYKITDHIFMCM